MTHELADDLRAEIAHGNVLVVVGAGVSMGATDGTPFASWQGLLENGVERCVGILGLEPARARLIRDEIRSGHVDDLLSAAEKISKVLGFPSGGEYRRWLRETIGSLHATNCSVLEALRDLGSPLATTNYDGLLEQVTDYPPVTWRDGDKAIRVIKKEEDGILHLHGHWDEPESVVLGIRSYEEVLRDGHAQAVLRALRTLRTLLFVGCGEGLADPNFGSLLRWGREVFQGVGSRHYRLCLGSELATLHALQKENSLYPVPYGEDYDRLGPFLRELGPPSRCSEVRGPTVHCVPVRTLSSRLPAAPRCFGREDEVRDLIETLLQPSSPPTPILGGPGAGKTTITLAALHDGRVAERFGSRRFFVHCDSAKNREALVGAIVSTIGLQPGPDVEGSLFEDLQRSPTVLVLDNAETPLEGMDQARVREILVDLENVTGLALVVSVRGQVRPWGPNWREAIRVGPLRLDAARLAFLDKSEKRFENDPDLDILLEEVDRLAIAVVLLGYHAQALDNLAELRRQWQAQKTTLLQRDGGEGRLENIEVSIEVSVSESSRMTAAAKRLLSVLAHLPDGVAESDLETLLPGDGEAAALVLRKVGLAFMQSGRIRVLAPIRECVRKKHPPEDKDLDRTLEHFLQLAREADRAGREGGAEVVASLVPELGNVDSMIARGLEKADPEPAIGAAAVLGKLICLSGWASSTPLERALEKARETGRDLLQANCAEQLGDIALDRFDHDVARARYEEASLLYSRIGSVLGEANCFVRLGDIAFDCSDYDNARAQYTEALTRYRGSDLGEAICIRRLGDISLACSEYAAAKAQYEQAGALFRQAEDVLGEGNCIQGLGDVALRRFDPEAASTLFKKALEIFERVKEPFSVGWTLVRLARIAEEGSEKRKNFLQGAQQAFESIKRLDFVEELREEFGEILA